MDRNDSGWLTESVSHCRLCRAVAKMTAEIAILNKYAVALATDSAVTISTAIRQEKIFDSADKLFELSFKNPIGIMIYNGMNFAEIPLQVLIHEFRMKCVEFGAVFEAAESFLLHLNEFARNAPQQVRKRSIENTVRPIIDLIFQRSKNKFIDQITRGKKAAEKANIESYQQILTATIARFQKSIDSEPDANFIGSGPIIIDSATTGILFEIVSDIFPTANSNQRAELLNICSSRLKKFIPIDGFTGVVIAGFGSEEKFPTLISLQLDGFVNGRLKYIKKEEVDIDRTGPKASVIPFAQKEMVDRFLFGLDEALEDQIAAFAKKRLKV